MSSQDSVAGRILIVQRPDGEAPEWVRDAWIGVELPLLAPGIVHTLGVGVLTAPKTRLGCLVHLLTGRTKKVRGYLVDAHRAVVVLEVSSPTAAAWWRTHAGTIIRPGGQFIFDAPACEMMD